jgi:thymidylate synthase (FAD)
MSTESIKVLDQGYVRLVDSMGSDLTVANAARVSFAKESKELSKNDERLIAFLAREGHTSPFRHATLQFEIKAPLMIARQWWKYVVGSDHTMDAWNESSRRYVTEEPVFYLPHADQWRSAPEDKKQGSGAPIDIMSGRFLTTALEELIERGEELYKMALERGVAVEQARLLLPAYGMYVSWYWTGSLQSVAHLINQRVAKDAQLEFQQYAKVIYELAKHEFPVAISHLCDVK